MGFFSKKNADNTPIVCEFCEKELGLNRYLIGTTASGRLLWKCPACAKKGGYHKIVGEKAYMCTKDGEILETEHYCKETPCKQQADSDKNTQHSKNDSCTTTKDNTAATMKNRKSIPKTVVLIWIAAMAITGIIGLFEIGSKELIIASWLTYIVLFFIPVTKFLIIPKIKEIKGRKNEDERFEKGEMTQAERESYIKRKIKFAEQAYHHGDLTLTQLEALKKKYTGESFYLDNFGIAGTVALDNKVQAELAIKRHNKAAERNMIINAAIGDAVGGTAGAIIGAATSAQKSAQEAVALEKQRAIADQNFQQTFDNACKNKFE